MASRLRKESGRRAFLPGGVGRLVRALRRQVVQVERVEAEHIELCPTCTFARALRRAGESAVGVPICEQRDALLTTWSALWRFRVAAEWLVGLVDLPEFLVDDWGPAAKDREGGREA